MKELIRDVPDFPKPGVIFRDIFPLLQKEFNRTVDELAVLVNPQLFDYVVGIEARGFIFASALAYKWNKGFIPIRKMGKLPPPSMKMIIEVEYGTDHIEVAKGSGKVLVVDDVIATGGTLYGATHLLKNAGYTVVQSLALINIEKLNDEKLMKELGTVPSLVQY